MASIPFFIASAAASLENGHGYTIIDPEGRFFCGFEQGDQSLVFASFRQKDGQDGQPIIKAFNAEKETYDTTKPVFLSTKEMTQRGLAAAAYSVKSLAATEDAIPRAVRKECKLGYVRKDLTYKAQKITLQSVAQSGLASSQACSKAEDAGYVSMKKEFSASVHELKNAVRKLFKPSGPTNG